MIGVNTAIFSPTGGSVGIGFAIPADVAKPITEQLMRGGKIERGYLGVEIQNLDRRDRRGPGPAGDARAPIVAERDRRAARPSAAACSAGDIVVAVNGDAVDRLAPS